MKKTEQTLVAGVSHERLIRFCQTLVRIPTVSPYSGDANPSGETKGQEFVTDLLREWGAEISLVPCNDEDYERAGVLAPKKRLVEGRPNVVATFKLGSGEGPTLVLDAHMDTVAVDNYQGNPYSGELCDGCIHGRGSSDDKQGVAVMLEVAHALLQADCNGMLVCCCVVDEECDGAGRGSLACINHLEAPDAAIVLDGQKGIVFNGCTGVVTAEITVHGKSGHAALGNSVNAIEKAVSLFPAFEQFRMIRNCQPGDFNLGVFQSGTHPANVPDNARLAMNIKTSIADMAAAEKTYGRRNGRLVREQLEACIDELIAKDPFLRENPPTVRWIKDVPAAQADARSASLIAGVASAHTEVWGEAPEVTLLGGWGDVSHFLNAGIPAFGIGSGFPGAAHANKEHVVVDDMFATAKTLTLLARRFFTQTLEQA